MFNLMIPFRYFPLSAVMITLLILLSWSGIVESQSRQGLVEFELNRTETTVGSPVYLTIDFSNEVRQQGNLILPQVPGLRFRILHSPTTIRRNTIVTRDWRYLIEVRADQLGLYTIPPIPFEANGRQLSTPVYQLKVDKAPQSSKFSVEVIKASGSGYVGEPMTLTLRIRITAFFDENRNRHMSPQFMWQRIDPRYSKLGLFKETMQKQRWRPNRHRQFNERQTDGTVNVIYEYEVDTEYIPKREGLIELPAVRLLMQYPIRIEYSSRVGPRGHLPEIRQSSHLLAMGGEKTIEVKPIPLEGQPEDFNGAVGTYRVMASANPVSLSVGDPITLNFFVSGGGPPPALHRVEALTKDFKVPSDPPAGHEQRGGKIYQFKIVPQHDELESIPPLPYSAFNTELEEYRTVFTRAIPIEVEAVVNLDLSQLIKDQEEVLPSQWAMNQRWSFNRRGLGLIYEWTGDRAILWTMLIVAVLVGLSSVILYFLLGRPQDNQKKKRKLAEREALKRIRDDTDLATLSRDLMAYLRLKLNLPTGAGRNEVLACLKNLSMPDEDIEVLSQILEEGRSESYMPMWTQTDEGLKQKTAGVLEALGHLSKPSTFKGVQ